MAVVLIAIAASMAQTADEILIKSIEARGGAAKLNGLKSMIMEATTSVMGMDLPTKTQIINKKGFRTDVEVMGQKITTAISGETGWMINPMQGGADPVELPAEQVKASASQMDLAGMTNYKEAGTTAEFLGKEMLDGTETFKVKTTSKDGLIITHFIDTKTYYTLKSIIKIQDIEVETKMSNYKMVDGIAFAHTTEVSNPQVGSLITTINKLEVNPVIDESIFAKPGK
ncbi:MAG: outer membrane lipoprotein-sorting protein [Spirosomataceae bacterium]